LGNEVTIWTIQTPTNHSEILNFEQNIISARVKRSSEKEPLLQIQICVWVLFNMIESTLKRGKVSCQAGGSHLKFFSDNLVPRHGMKKLPST
jgi:hypothetical protein